MRFHTAISNKDTKRAHLRAVPMPNSRLPTHNELNGGLGRVFLLFCFFFFCPIILYLNMFLTLQVFCVCVMTSGFVLLGLPVFVNLCLFVSICVSSFFVVFFPPFVLSCLLCLVLF